MGDARLGQFKPGLHCLPLHLSGPDTVEICTAAGHDSPCLETLTLRQKQAELPVSRKPGEP